MSDLKTLINTTRESRELKRALAVQNTLAGPSVERGGGGIGRVRVLYR